ncbi:rod shape-determining protein [Ostreibacterium oceani]|uniref:Cell shape-determining protein MreB n=1 Tax=Ostreibacterium oceani TaxID=2654998 RepID=A0A6N7EUF8_9GAMM|nr:rod shape-determining protein [Ostreibacterium oceani]MPV86424.1 MreB/Mrl family cell shape determining protein [Ostreibacterium oceani]
MFKGFRKLFSSDLAIDLGTANTLIYVNGEGIVLDEPSIVAIRTLPEGGKEPAAFGNEAKQMLGRTPAGLETVRPLRDGMIADLQATEHMLNYFIKKIHKRTLSISPSPTILVCVPSGATQVERRALLDAARRAGGHPVYWMEEPMAAAIGANMPVEEARGSMIIDIGGGTSEVAVLSLSGIVYSNSIRIGGDKFDEAIIDYVRRNFGVYIGYPTAERIKKEIGCAYPTSEVLELELKGLSQQEGAPRSFTMNSNEVLEALQEPLGGIVKAVKYALEQTPPELAGDVAERGIVLAGGGALLRDIDKLLMEETGLNVIVAEDPLTCVVNGAGKIIDLIDTPEALPFISEG